MLLKLHGKAVSPTTFFAEVSVRDDGLALSDMRDASVRYGLPAEVRRCTYAELVDQCPLPLIALLREDIGPAGRRNGHYVLVLEANISDVVLLDGTTGETIQYPRDAYLSDWQGYVLMATSGEPNWFLLLAVSGAAWAIVGWFVRRSRRAGDVSAIR
jgi:ABC-type bacteriocin/lantibiotic exporter with double-glycine peptidase domain